MPSYSAEALARAAAPVSSVVDSFLAADEGATGGQGRFVSLLLSLAGGVPSRGDGVDWASTNFLPSRRYIRVLVQRYISHLEEQGEEVEDDDLASLVCQFSMERWTTVPDPTCPSVVTFRIPRCGAYFAGKDEPNLSTEKDIVRIRTYTHHNDVGVAKVWEAGACLAEYLMHKPQLVENRNIVELGAGVGLTGLVTAGVASARSVHMTDYTEACMDNLAHNVLENADWLSARGVSPQSVTIGRLEWGDYSKDNDSNTSTIYIDNPPWANSIQALAKADVLLAADVIYDVNCIPDLVATVSKFLRTEAHSARGSEGRQAVFATTFRNKDTFALFEGELEEHGIACEYHSLEELPNVFPCYWNQPRSDVRVCTMRAREESYS